MELEIRLIVVAHAVVLPPISYDPGSVRPNVTLYSRPGCGLCDEAREVLMAVRRRIAFELHEVDISGDDALERAYGVRIPVVLVDGEERFEISVDEGELEAAIGD
jgi:glutaredoxin